MEHISSTYDLYRDIKRRTGGEIYIGVLGPVRTGKSTFIKRFMEEMVLPFMSDEHAKIRAMDELPQSAGGKTITTTEPKFIPNEAAKVKLSGDISVQVRLIDCVGYMVDGAGGHMEDERERMVKTPWSEEEIPFTQAAEIGTDKVMHDHSTIGIVITTDASFSEIPRRSYLEAEERTIQALKRTQKPFIVLVNSAKPYSEEAKKVADEISNKYMVPALPINCDQLKKEDINTILENVLYEFPITSIEFFEPNWVEMLPDEHECKFEMLQKIRNCMNKYNTIHDFINQGITFEGDFVSRCKQESVNLSDGCIKLSLEFDEKYYYSMLSEMIGEAITDEIQLVKKLKTLSDMKHEYMKVQDAVNLVRLKGYGVVTPDKEEIKLEKPELIKHGNKYGVKIKAISPSIHMIKANIETEIAPIVGNEEQAKDLIEYISRSETEAGIWDTNIFGKTVEQLVNDGITAKVAVIGEESQMKLQDSMQKIVNDSSGGMICIII